MIEIKIRKGLITHTKKWFSVKPHIKDALGFSDLFQCGYGKIFPGLIRQKFYTKIISLTKSADELLAQCSKNTVYKINRAQRENVRFEIENDIDSFIDYVNNFTASKKMAGLNKSEYQKYRDYITMTKAVFENEVLVMHSYITDRAIGRISLLNSASQFRSENDSQKKNLIGRANRFLHYREMLYFKEQGFSIYDLGGYALDTTDEDLQRINEFKDSFGGELMEESLYVSLPLWLFRKAKNLLTPA